VVKLARDEVAKTGAEIRRIEWHRGRYRLRITEIEKEMGDIWLKRANLGFSEAERKREFSGRIEELSKEKARIEKVFGDRFGVGIYDEADDLLRELREKEELSRIFVDFNKARRHLGRLKYRNLEQRRTSENQSIERQIAYLEGQRRDLDGLGREVGSLQKRLENAHFSGEARGLEWQVLHLENFNAQVIEGLDAEIKKIKKWTDSGIYRLREEAKSREIRVDPRAKPSREKPSREKPERPDRSTKPSREKPTRERPSREPGVLMDFTHER